MSSSNSNNVINLKVVKFPQNLIIPNGDNLVSFQVINISNKEQKLKFDFEGESLEITFEPEEFKGELEFGSGETKNLNLKLNPTSDGYGKLIINAYWMKLVQYTVKVRKIRDIVSSSKIKKILSNVKDLTIDSGDKFKAKKFFTEAQKSTIKNLEKEIKSMKMNYNPLDERAVVTLEDIDAKIRLLAKQYLSVNEFYKALETALELSNETEKIQFYYDLIRAYATVDLQACLHLIKSIKDEVKKVDIIKKLALDFIDSNHDQIIKILNLVENPSDKEEVIAKIVGIALRNDYRLALKLSYLIKEELLKFKILFNVIKKLYENKNKEEILSIVGQINQIILNSPKIILNSHNVHDPIYEYLRNSINILAELDSPEAADKIIKNIRSQDVKEKIIKDLFNEIYILVDELRTKVEPTLIFSQYYLLNIFSSKIINEVKEFSRIGGNVSNNLLLKDYSFKVAFISLFSYDFSIFPIIDRIYSDLKFNANKSIAYYIYPSVNQHNEEELNIIQNTLRLFVPVNKISNQVYLFNLDFIPYLGKPTVILASDSEDVALLKSNVLKKLGDKAQVLIDNSFFAGGQTSTTLRNIFNSYNFKIINLILSYEFLNDYNILKAFIESMI